MKSCYLNLYLLRNNDYQGELLSVCSCNSWGGINITDNTLMGFKVVNK